MLCLWCLLVRVKGIRSCSGEQAYVSLIMIGRMKVIFCITFQYHLISSLDGMRPAQLVRRKVVGFFCQLVRRKRSSLGPMKRVQAVAITSQLRGVSLWHHDG